MSFDPGDVLAGAALVISGGTFALAAKYLSRCERKFHQLDAVTEEVFNQQNTVVRPVEQEQLPQSRRAAPPPSRIISGGQVAQKQISAPTRRTTRRPAQRPKQELDQIYNPPSGELFQGKWEEGVIYYHER
jgi:hypothetical protein